MKGTPRTRQSLLTLAAFRPWGSSQDGRHAGSAAQSRGYPAERTTAPDEAVYLPPWLAGGTGGNLPSGGFA